jgi:hypothetical protein
MLCVENDSAVEDVSNESDNTGGSREALSEDDADISNDEYTYDEYQQEEDMISPPINDDDQEEDEVEEDDESTPHVGSETSKTQSPSSVGNIREAAGDVILS